MVLFTVYVNFASLNALATLLEADVNAFAAKGVMTLAAAAAAMVDFDEMIVQGHK